MPRASKLLVTAAVAAAALPLGGCEESSFCGVPVLSFLFCDPNQNSTAPAQFDTNDPPTASFTVNPPQPIVGRGATFTNTSNDPDGILPGLQGIDSSEWDLDGDGTFETPGNPHWTNTGYRDTVNQTYSTAGTRRVKLRVTDWEGATAVVERDVVVGGGSATPGTAGPTSPGLHAAGVTPPPHAFVGRLSLGSFATADTRRRSRSVSGVLVRGRLSASLVPAVSATGQRFPSPPRALSRMMRSPLSALLDGTTNTTRTRQRLRLVGLATLRGRPSGRVCFVLRLTNRTGRQPSGTLRLLGGTGAGARLFGSGRVRGELRSARIARIGVTVRTRTARPRALPAGCRALLP